MTSSFHDILTAICTDVKLLNENDLQVNFSLETPQEAQLAYDVLAAHGFDVRIYHENGASKLYINRSAAVVPPQERLAATLAHAQTLRHILDTMEDVGSTDYQISFANNLDMGKQISIYFPSREQPSHMPAAGTLRPTAPARPRPTAAAYPPAAVNRGRRMHKKSALMAAGPSVTKKTIFANQSGFGSWLHNYVVSHFAESFLAFCGMIFLAIVTVSLLVTSKAYLCPDLAVVESKAWYCNLSFRKHDEKPKQQEQ